MGKLTNSTLKLTGAGLVPTGETYSIIWISLVKKYQDKRALVKILERSSNNSCITTPRLASKSAAITPAQPARTTYKTFVARNDSASSSMNNEPCVLRNNCFTDIFIIVLNIKI